MRAKDKNICLTPRCGQKRLEGRNFCKACAANLDRIRREFEEDPKLIYNQRSDNPDRMLQDEPKRRAKKVPTCSMIGCFEHRQPPSPYCDLHMDCGLED